jgi:regulator of sigma D
MFGLFKKKPAPTPAPVVLEARPPVSEATAPSKPSPSAPVVPYQAGLVDEFKDDHRAQMIKFSAIKNAYTAGNLSSVAEELDHFRIMVQAHLLAENLQLYAYLEHQQAGDPGNHRLIKDFLSEMSCIGNDIISFLAKYREIGTHPELAETFGTDLDRIGVILTARIQREEKTLYPLYLPS